MRHNIRNMRKNGLIEALFPQVRIRILATLLLQAERKWYLSDLAQHIRKSPSSLQRELAALVQAGILIKTMDGNRTYYQADPTCPIFPELRGLLVKTAGLVDQVRDALSPLASKIQVAFIFGSFATGAERSASDVDLLVIGSVKLTALSKYLPQLEARLARAVNPVLYTEEEFRESLGNGNHFLTSVSNEPKLFIIGTESDLARLTERGAGKGAQDVENRDRRPARRRQA
jgi:predicted nucleotidyltransferase